MYAATTLHSTQNWTTNLHCCYAVIHRIPFHGFEAGSLVTRDDLLLGHFDFVIGLDGFVQVVGIWHPNLESCSDRCKRYLGLKTERIEYPQQKVTGHAGSVALEYCGHFCPRSSRKFCGLVVREVLSLDDVFDLVSNFCSEFDLNSVLRRQIENVAKLENVVCDINLCFAPLYRFNISHNLFFAVSISFCGVVCAFFAKA